MRRHGAAFEAILLTVITASTPLLLAASGELVVERSGVLNLGVEGMMIMGAVMRLRRRLSHRIDRCRRICRGIVGRHALLALLFGFLTLTLVANQVATGLALTLLGLGLSGLIGAGFVGSRSPAARAPHSRA